MKSFIFISIFPVVICACSIISAQGDGVQAAVDTVPPVILISRPVDTAYLYTSYQPQDVRVVEESRKDCNSGTLHVSGEVNLNLAGTYILTYDAEDSSGNHAASVTRTVHVVGNSSSFLNGLYDAVCTCTVVNKSSAQPTIETSSYTAQITSEPLNGFFKLISVNVGKDHVAMSSRLQDSLFEVQFFNPDYHLRSGGTGVLSSSKNSFTIETVAYHFSGDIFSCRNVYNKRLVEQKLK